MISHGTDLILILALIVVGGAAIYLLLLRRIGLMVTERNLKIADQFGALEDAIRSLETRLAEHRAAAELIEGAQGITLTANDQDDTLDAEESGEVAPDIQAVIAAAAVAALGKDVHVRSIRPATSSWSQQGRVLVQGSHNARARR